MICPKCGGEHVQTQVVVETIEKKRGCLGWVVWILIACTIIGLIFLLIPMFSNSKKKTKTYTMAVCQDCGHTWRV
jgi:uncharacterized Zn finger protein